MDHWDWHVIVVFMLPAAHWWEYFLLEAMLSHGYPPEMHIECSEVIGKVEETCEGEWTAGIRNGTNVVEDLFILEEVDHCTNDSAEEKTGWMSSPSTGTISTESGELQVG